jgi:hypothetical protein
MVLLVGLGLLLSDQGRDVLVAYGEDQKTGRLALAAFGWALSIWGWSRFLLDLRADDPPSHRPTYNRVRQWLPRVLGAAAFLVLAGGAWRAGRVALAAWSLAALVLFLTLVIQRRRVARGVARLLGRSGSPAVRARAHLLDVPPFDLAGEPPHATLRAALHRGEGAGANPLAWRPSAALAALLLLTLAVLYLLGHVAPVWLGVRSGAVILFFLWAIAWLPLGSLLSYLADRRGLPLLTLLTTLAIASSFWNDNHRIRALEGGAVGVDRRPTVDEALEAWGRRNAPSERGPGTPFVVVATAGGGIRAAYWTATALGELHDRSPAFDERTFAVSGVSGGSVGAAVYRALATLPTAGPSVGCRAGLRACGQAVLSQEFLGPLAAALLFPDLAQRFFPFPWFPDRARALEQSWEEAFRTTTGQDGLAGSLASLSASPGPHLFLNATWAANGRRIVASDLRFGGEDRSLLRSNDQLAVLGHDLRLSTAAHNSARFPFVSPAGMWRDPRTGAIAGRLQDGGLFENYGAETAIELFDEACRVFACGSWSVDAGPDAFDTRPRIRPVLLLISSDPNLPADYTSSPRNLPLRWGYELGTTLLTYESVRNGRGSEAASRLIDQTLQAGGAVFELRMCDGESPEPQPPLGWALSDAARSRINQYLFPSTAPGARPTTCLPANSKAVTDLSALLAGGR